MNKFWTITDINTEHTNSRSQRFSSMEAAVRSAESRLMRNQSEGVFVLECVKVVIFSKPPIEVLDVGTAEGELEN